MNIAVHYLVGAKIIDGQVVATNVKSHLIKDIEELGKNRICPSLATVLVGDDTASTTYINSKQKAAADIGIKTQDHRLTCSTSQTELIELIELLNRDSSVHGILVQLPLPSHIDEFLIINKINPLKDVDGLTPFNVGMLFNGRALLKPCTPSGIIELLDFYKINVESMDSVIVNRSNLVGKPISLLLLARDATVTICHSKSKNLTDLLRRADLIITAVGNRNKFTLTGNMIRDKCIVIDVGITRHLGKISGDADFDSIKEKASWVTPVPGGVGPMTIAMLLNNTVTAAKSLCSLSTEGS